MTDNKKFFSTITPSQDSTVNSISKNFKINKGDILRTWLDLIDDVSGEVTVIVFNNNTIRMMKDFASIIDLKNDDEVESFKLFLEYEKGNNVKYSGTISKNELIGNGGIICGEE